MSLKVKEIAAEQAHVSFGDILAVSSANFSQIPRWTVNSWRLGGDQQG